MDCVDDGDGDEYAIESGGGIGGDVGVTDTGVTDTGVPGCNLYPHIID